MKKQLFIPVIILGCLGTPYTHTAQRTGWSTEAVLGVTALAGAVTYGLYKLVAWFSPSTESKLKTHESDLNAIATVYKPIFTALVNVMQNPQLALTRGEETLQIAFHTLYQLRHDFVYYCTPSRLHKHIVDLQKIQHETEKLLPSLTGDPLIITARLLLDDTSLMIAELTLITDFFTKHNAFFVLQDALRVRNSHRSTLHVMATAHALCLTPELRIAITGMGISIVYPYTAYAAKLQGDIQTIDKALTAQALLNYPLTANIARDWRMHAQQLLALLISDATYTEEMRHKQLIEVEKRRTELMEAQLRAQRDLAAAQERQARALEIQAFQQNQHMRALEQQARERTAPEAIVVVVN